MGILNLGEVASNLEIADLLSTSTAGRTAPRTGAKPFAADQHAFATPARFLATCI